MPKKLKVSDSGDELEIPQDHIIEVSYSKAKQLMKQPREMSEKQRDNIQRLVAMNKEKKVERDKLKQDQERSIREQTQAIPKQKVIVKPKRIFKKKQELPASNQYIENKIKQQQQSSESELSEEEEEDDESEEEVQTIKKPTPKPKVNKIHEMETKLKQIEQNINKPVQKVGKYDMSKFWSKK